MIPPQIPELIDRFNAVAGPYLCYFPAASCIEQSRILVEVLQALDVKAEAVGTAMTVLCPALNVAYVTGVTAEERARGKAAAGEWVDRPSRDGKAGEDCGHVVVVAVIDCEHFLIDPTIGQASMPERGVVIPRYAMPIGPLSQRPEPGCELVAGLDLGDGKSIEVTWLLREARTFEATPAWEPSHLWPLIGRVVREMKWAATVAARRRSPS